MKTIYFRTYDDKMIVYNVIGSNVSQIIRDTDGKEYKSSISLKIFEQLREEVDIWQVKI